MKLTGRVQQEHLWPKESVMDYRVFVGDSSIQSLLNEDAERVGFDLTYQTGLDKEAGFEPRIILLKDGLKKVEVYSNYAVYSTNNFKQEEAKDFYDFVYDIDSMFRDYVRMEIGTDE